MSAKSKHRTTLRKSLIERFLSDEYAGGPVLLEELRWKVLSQQYGPSFTKMSEAKKKSFARTIREHMPELARQEIAVDIAPAGLVARAALYRIATFQTIRQFQDSFIQSVVFNVAFPDNEYRGEDFQRTTLGCYFKACPEDRVQHGPSLELVIIPKSHRLKVVRRRPLPPDLRLDTLAEVPWTLFFVSRNNPNVWQTNRWTELLQCDPLRPIPFP